ncbi:hypothetical protein BGZ83_000230 [Gryganskiella cystojenkinii]|nr:hypothetical protein BGZ83_000230 [Gryganskiella cystojenkinii]
MPSVNIDSFEAPGNLDVHENLEATSATNESDGSEGCIVRGNQDRQADQDAQHVQAREPHTPFLICAKPLVVSQSVNQGSSSQFRTTRELA